MSATALNDLEHFISLRHSLLAAELEQSEKSTQLRADLNRAREEALVALNQDLESPGSTPGREE